MITLKNRIELIAMYPAGSVIAEVGVWRAYFSTAMLELPNIRKLYLVDAWEQYPEYDDTINTQDQEDNLRQAKHNIRGHLPGGRVEIIRGRSLDVARDNRTIPPLDGLFLDANHGRGHVLADLRAWSKRMKPGAAICGHDYFDNEESQRLNFGVVEDVNQFCAEEGWDLTHVTDEAFASFRIVPKSWTGAEL